jgi:hypothetical protein
MRKIHKEHLTELAETLIECSLEINKNIHNFSIVKSLSSDAVSFIDAFYNYAKPSLVNVESKSEILEKLVSIKKILSDLLTNNNYTEDFRFNKLNTLTDDIFELIQSLPVDRIEVLFLPYKSAMADSLESIWDAAISDPICDTYICPIPYYDIDSDGKLCKEHFDYSDYDSSLPLVNYKEYNIETRRPDIIFIHNPYDEYNLITRVHPAFYSSRLCKYTDMLVYVPYFTAIRNIAEQYVTLPGCFYATKIFVESEKVKQRYIEIMNESLAEADDTEEFLPPEEKIVVCGSPKADKIISSDKRNITLPKEWRELIGNKKIVFLNTTIDAVLRGNERYFEKLRFVLNYFKKRDDVILWWRPHPLFEDSLKAIHPEYLTGYLKITDEYKKEKYGIFDETGDSNRPIILADGYYGGRSSMLTLFNTQEKTALLMDFFSADDDLHVRPSTVIKSENKYYITFNCIDALFKADSITGEIEIAAKFPTMSKILRKYNAYGFPAVHKGKIYFPPSRELNIGVYSPNSDLFYTIDYKNSEKGFDYSRAFSDGEYVYFTPNNSNAFMRLKPETNEIDYFSDWATEAGEITDKNVFKTGYNAVFHNGVIRSAVYYTNIVLAFDTKTLKTAIEIIGNSDYQFKGLCFDGTAYWLSPSKDSHSPIVKWMPETGYTEEFRGIGENDELTKCFNAQYNDGYVHILPIFADNGYSIDINTGKASINNLFGNGLEKELKLQKYSMVQNIDDVILAFDIYNNCFVTYKSSDKELTVHKHRFGAGAESFIRALIGDSLIYNHKKPNFKKLYIENSAVRLSDFVDFLVNCEDTLSPNENAESSGQNGKTIYEYCKGQVI